MQAYHILTKNLSKHYVLHNLYKTSEIFEWKLGLYVVAFEFTYAWCRGLNMLPSLTTDLNLHMDQESLSNRPKLAQYLQKITFFICLLNI